MLHLRRILAKRIATYPSKGRTVGYVRVSSFEQNEGWQIEGLGPKGHEQVQLDFTSKKPIVNLFRFLKEEGKSNRQKVGFRGH